MELPGLQSMAGSFTFYFFLILVHIFFSIAGMPAFLILFQSLF